MQGETSPSPALLRFFHPLILSFELFLAGSIPCSPTRRRMQRSGTLESLNRALLLPRCRLSTRQSQGHRDFPSAETRSGRDA